MLIFSLSVFLAAESSRTDQPVVFWRTTGFLSSRLTETIYSSTISSKHHKHSSDTHVLFSQLWQQTFAKRCSDTPRLIAPVTFLWLSLNPFLLSFPLLVSSFLWFLSSFCLHVYFLASFCFIPSTFSWLFAPPASSSFPRILASFLCCIAPLSLPVLILTWTQSRSGPTLCGSSQSSHMWVRMQESSCPVRLSAERRDV